MIIYKATNKTNGKSYIGQSTFDLEKRKGEHLKGSQRQKPKYFLHRAIKKYGMNDFDWEVLAECETKEELDRTELWFIRKHKTITPHGYNMIMMSRGGDLFNSHPNKEDIRKRISEGTKKGIARSKKSWSKFGKANGMYGRKHSPESIKKMKRNRRGKCLGDNNPMRDPEICKKQHLADVRNTNYKEKNSKVKVNLAIQPNSVDAEKT